MAELSSSNRDYKALQQNLKYLLSHPFQKKFASPWLNATVVYYFSKFCGWLGSAEQVFFLLRGHL